MIPRTVPPVHSPLSAAAVARAWLPAGGHSLARVEALLRAEYRARQVWLTDSGTSALALALRLALARRSDAPRVALPAWACYDLATAVEAANAVAVLYDLDPATLGPDWNSLDRALGSGVAAVVVVHAYGLPVNLPEVTERASRSGAVVIEDAAQAVGATLEGVPAGGSGAMGVLSFGRGKGWTGGGGGALLFGSSAPGDFTPPYPKDLAPPGGRLGTAARLSVQWLLARPAVYAIPSSIPFLKLGQTIYRDPEPPGRMSSAEAGILLVTAEQQRLETTRRRGNAERLGRAVEACAAGTVPSGWAGGEPGWLRLPLIASGPVLQRALSPGARRLGISPGYPIPLARLPGFGRRLSQGNLTHPGAELLAERLLTLPTHGMISAADLARLERWLSTA